MQATEIKLNTVLCGKSELWKFYIYQIWFPTSKKSYIGYTNCLNRRMLQHLDNRYNRILGNALSKYNDWKICILYTVKTRDEAKRIEIEEIRNFNSIAPNGYNLTRGGDGGGGIGNINGQGNKGNIHLIEQNKNHSDFMKENHPLKGKKNPNAHCVKSEIKRLKTRIKNLEKEI